MCPLPDVESATGVGAITLHLREEIIDRVELLLVSQVLDEAHLGSFAVQVAVPVEQVCLEQAVRLRLVELRPTAEGDRRRSRLARRTRVPTGIDAVGGQKD